MEEFNMDNMDINTLLQDLENYVDSASRVPLTGKVMVDGDFILEIIDKIHAILPEEMKQAKQVLEQSDKLLESIETQGKKMIEEAKNQAGQIVNETEIVQLANKEAERIMDEAKAYGESVVKQAQQNAEDITAGAQNYVDSILFQLESNLDKVTASVKDTRNNFKNSSR